MMLSILLVALTCLDPSSRYTNLVAPMPSISASRRTSLFPAITSITPETFYYARDRPRKGRSSTKTRRLSLDDTESRAEISAPQFGDNRIPPLHTILGVTVRYNA